MSWRLRVVAEREERRSERVRAGQGGAGSEPAIRQHEFQGQVTARSEPAAPHQSAGVTQGSPGSSMSRRGASWRIAISMFSVLPVRGPARVDRSQAARAVLFLPALGGLLGGCAAAVLYGVEFGDPGSAPRRLLGSALAVATLAVLTGGLHLDGLADTADGLGSRRTGTAALDIMRRSDVGPMGVAALVFTVLIQVSALAAVKPGWTATIALVGAAVMSRTAVIAAAGAPSARPDGFGALVSGAAGTFGRWSAVVAAVIAFAAVGALAGGPGLAARTGGAAVCGLIVAAALRGVAVRRLGGMTGDAFGALIETCAAVVLVVLALS